VEKELFDYFKSNLLTKEQEVVKVKGSVIAEVKNTLLHFIIVA
jgi:hypothetical protein